MMANSSTYIKYYFLLIILFVTINDICVATQKHRKMMVVQGGHDTTNTIDLKHFRRKHGNEGLVFNSLPKGRNRPTSTPSKRHNSFVDSTHN
ncbi:hypothetical protein vseg_001679 [Gypsophila vaccaria]